MESQAYFLTLEAGAEQKSQDILSNAGGSAVTALSRHRVRRDGSGLHSVHLTHSAHVKHTDCSQHFCLCSPLFLIWKRGIQNLFRTSGLEPEPLTLQPGSHSESWVRPVTLNSGTAGLLPPNSFCLDLPPQASILTSQSTEAVQQDTIGLSNRRVFSQNSGGQKFKNKAQEGWFLVTRLILACRLFLSCYIRT